MENKTSKRDTKDKTYIIREAESVISNYINSVQSREKLNELTFSSKKYKMLKFYSIFITIGLILISIFH